jgi:hypothetical protein
MPLPLPNLDTRRWQDLVDEARALIPRYAPAWTDHNAHDPGVTLIELVAWLVEQQIYRVNRIPDRHRRKFLALAGFFQRPPAPARVELTFRLKAGEDDLVLPGHTAVAAEKGRGAWLRFRTAAPTTVTAAEMRAIQVWDGEKFSDRTRAWSEGLPIAVFGENPAGPPDNAAEQGPALYVGLDRALPVNKTVSLWLWFHGPRTGRAERRRLREETQRAAGNGPPGPFHCPCSTEDGDGGQAAVCAHHAVRTVWEYSDGHHWHRLDAEAGEVVDDTRGMTLDGGVRVTVPASMAATPVGLVSGPLFYLRCRLAAGRPDAAPMLRDAALHTVATEQVWPVRSTLPIAAGVSPPPGQEPEAGKRAKLRLQLDAQGSITDLAVDPGGDLPEVLVLEYRPAAVDAPGALTAALLPIGPGTGRPQQRFTLPDAPIAGGRAEIWTADGSELLRWQQRPDLDSSARTDADFTLDPQSGELRFGDGERGRVVPAGAWVLAVYEGTAGAAGNLAAGAAWRVDGADDAVNRALLGEDPAAVAATLQAVVNRTAAAGGADEETLNQAAGRAAKELWAHERLIELCPPGRCRTLDQLDRDRILALAPPARAVTLADFERLALTVPGTRVARVRAWAGIDPQYPCLQAPGTITVVVVPELPRGRPTPTAGLLRAVHTYLDRRRLIGTRVVVVGPAYLAVGVRAEVRARADAQIERVHTAILEALDAFLEPLAGGPAQRGWPFGRDVYRAEILQVIDAVAGVDHVLSLELVAEQGEAQCGNLCVGATWLVTPGLHHIEVV